MQWFQDSIEKYYPNNTILIGHVSNAIAALSKINFANTSSGMSSFDNSLAATTMTGLYTIAVMIPCSEEILSTDAIAHLKEDISTILDDILVANISSKLKDILSNRIQDILVILNKYYIYGNDELIKAFETSIGSVCINASNTQSETEKGFCKLLLTKLTQVISFSNTTFSFAEHIEKLLS